MAIHPHGTTGRIRQGCTCNLCTLVQAQMGKPRHLPGSVPARPARDHLDALIASGWPIRDLADHTGYGTSTLYGIRSGAWQFTSRYIAEDILSVPLTEVAA